MCKDQGRNHSAAVINLDTQMPEYMHCVKLFNLSPNPEIQPETLLHRKVVRRVCISTRFLCAEDSYSLMCWSHVNVSHHQTNLNI